MRQLLVIAVLVVLSGAAALSQGSEAKATTQVFLYVWQPTGDAQHPLLMCGWHTNCDNDYPDNTATPNGLDWEWQNGSSATKIRARLVGPPTGTYVGYGKVENQQPSGPCLKLRVPFRSPSDGHIYGYVRQFHTLGFGTNIVWAAGIWNDILTGYMVDHDDDNCSSYDHVHQTIQDVDFNIVSQNVGGFPTEAQCFHCESTAYDTWQPVEWILGYEY